MDAVQFTLLSFALGVLVAMAVDALTDMHVRAADAHRAADALLRAKRAALVLDQYDPVTDTHYALDDSMFEEVAIEEMANDLDRSRGWA